ncbi:tRNA (adenosine(37)-N6)-threonylcarbamoyltransferase complex ATPase subunit type 1 TsaE [Candidatus Woesebacteria bacterium]|nr:tRNA (adenosine(37)-N6)-threonylcarbamoyltransferase complex ATPase subunit type 1 TsaE [Candidatus Woesebacteria bacterium]QQG47930.1 MAG: tRNA (adenosine(37)-N6)-threonylcarbamoyltransferase complex ATPase subunit type 1 TsaE [Candidatus Woesebacteria bacterium]
MLYSSKNEQETQQIAKNLSSNLKGGEILALVGNLGAGKTTFIQGLGLSLGIDRVISPTFILMRKYKTKRFSFYHIDLYRLEVNLKEEIKNLGITDIWGKKENVVAIEWADKIKDLLPKNTIWINFKNIKNQERQIEII